MYDIIENYVTNLFKPPERAAEHDMRKSGCKGCFLGSKYARKKCKI